MPDSGIGWLYTNANSGPIGRRCPGSRNVESGEEGGSWWHGRSSIGGVRSLQYAWDKHDAGYD